MANYFISFEGGDGSGKSTQLDNIRKYLEEKGVEYIFTREPGGTPIGEKIRDVILDPNTMEMEDVTEAMLYAASRAQHVRELIKPALDRGVTVVCDRFVDSSYAYQGYGRGLEEMVKVINDYAVDGCMPDVTFFLDITPEDAMARISNRGHDRLEKQDEEFHKKVYEGYKAISRDRMINIDANRDPEEVWQDIKKVLDDLCL